MAPSFRWVSARNLEETLHESSRSFSAGFRRENQNGLLERTPNLAEFSPRKFAFEKFVRGVNAKKKLFSCADLYL